jgi:hypothetical protein
MLFRASYLTQAIHVRLLFPHHLISSVDGILASKLKIPGLFILPIVVARELWYFVGLW